MPSITIGPVRISYVHVWEAKAMEGGEKAKFSVTPAIPKTDKAMIEKIQKAVEAAKQEGLAKCWGGKIPPSLKLPLRDADKDRPDDAGLKGSYFMGCNSTDQPTVIDRARNPITDKSQVYSGMFAFLSLSIYPYASGGSKGIACTIDHIMKWSDGEKLDGRISVTEAFADVPMEDIM